MVLTMQKAKTVHIFIPAKNVCTKDFSLPYRFITSLFGFVCLLTFYFFFDYLLQQFSALCSFVSLLI